MYSELSLVSAYKRELGSVTPFATPLVAVVVAVCALTMVTPSSDVAIATAAQAADVLVDLMTFRPLVN
jgi:D-alanyl-D-alanine carboxypeptidase